MSSVLCRRFRSTDCRSFLDHAKSMNKNMGTAITMGSLYELSTKEILTSKLNMNGLQCCGGANDKGLDLFGKWNLKHYYNKDSITTASKKSLASVRLHEKLVHPILRSTTEYQTLNNIPLKRTSIPLENAGNVLVQCKNTKAPVSAKTIRELAGIYFYHVRTPTDAKNSFMFLCAAKNLTKQARVQFDTANFPLVFCRITPLTISNIQGDPYDMGNWSGGEIKEFYCNTYSQQLLKGLEVESRINEMIKEDETA